MRHWLSQADINNAQLARTITATRSKTCPVSQLIKRLVPDGTYVSTGLTRARVGFDKDTNQRFVLGQNARKVINDFDAGRKVVPTYVTIVNLENYAEPQPLALLPMG